ncbi:hypothetical protein BHE74_00037134 [Ensete ventricosum]|nr:hypothetical protein BHE74_00037134 [Ensete ventricosum]
MGRKHRRDSVWINALPNSIHRRSDVCAYFVTGSVEGARRQRRQELRWQEKWQLYRRLLLSRMSKREICRWEEMAHDCSSYSGSYCAQPDAMGCEERLERDGLSFDGEEGVAGSEDQIAGKEEEATRRWGAPSTRLGSRKQRLWWRKSSGWKIIVVNKRAKDAAVATGDGDGCDGGSDHFAVAHTATELTMGAARDEEKGVVSNVRRVVGRVESSLGTRGKRKGRCPRQGDNQVGPADADNQVTSGTGGGGGGGGRGRRRPRTCRPAGGVESTDEGKETRVLKATARTPRAPAHLPSKPAGPQRPRSIPTFLLGLLLLLPQHLHSPTSPQRTTTYDVFLQIAQIDDTTNYACYCLMFTKQAEEGSAREEF